jgi:hypothetical protein
MLHPVLLGSMLHGQSGPAIRATEPQFKNTIEKHRGLKLGYGVRKERSG